MAGSRWSVQSPRSRMVDVDHNSGAFGDLFCRHAKAISDHYALASAWSVDSPVMLVTAIPTSVRIHHNQREPGRIESRKYILAAHERVTDPPLEQFVKPTNRVRE
ncbi:MAG: hypothetical protein ACRDRI_13045 [Pseudonocardiaceae bacterium]